MSYEEIVKQLNEMGDTFFEVGRLIGILERKIYELGKRVKKIEDKE